MSRLKDKSNFHSPQTPNATFTGSNPNHLTTPQWESHRSSSYSNSNSTPTEASMAAHENIETNAGRMRVFSVFELDKIQRQRREENQRRNVNASAELVSETLASMVDKVHENHQEDGSYLPQLATSRFTAEETKTSHLSQVATHHHRNNRLRSRSFGNNGGGILRGLPRLKLRPLRNSSNADNEPMIIQPRHQHLIADKLNHEMFPSPDSNRFVLQFPNNPMEELALDDTDDNAENDLNSRDHGKINAPMGMDFNVMDVDELEVNDTMSVDDRLGEDHFSYLEADQKMLSSPNAGPKNSNHTNESQEEQRMFQFKRHGNLEQSVMTKSKPSRLSNTRQVRMRKMKISLQPKPLGDDHEDSPTNSCSSAASSVDQIIPSFHSQRRPLPAELEIDLKHPKPKPMAPSLAPQMTNSIVNELFQQPPPPSNDHTTNHEINQEQKSSMPFLPSSDNDHDMNKTPARDTTRRTLQLQPKATLLHRLSSSFLSRSQSQEVTFDEDVKETNNDGLVDLKLPSSSSGQSKLLRKNSSSSNQSIVYTPSPPRKRFGSASQDQIELAKEAAARFGSHKNNLSFSNHTILSPSQLSESNFRTPVTAPKRGWFHLRDLDMDSNGHEPNDNIRNSNGSSSVGLFLPGLFGSASDDEPMGHRRSGSLIHMMKEAFSPL